MIHLSGSSFLDIYLFATTIIDPGPEHLPLSSPAQKVMVFMYLDPLLDFVKSNSSLKSVLLLMFVLID